MNGLGLGVVPPGVYGAPGLGARFIVGANGDEALIPVKPGVKLV